jgi:hypothetical protein
MGSLSNYAENELLDHVLKVGAYTQPTNLYIALSTADPTEDGSGLAEPSGGSYARVLCNGWDTAASRATQNTAAIQFARASGSWGTVTHFAIFDAITGGNMIAHGALSSPSSLAIASGMRPRFAAGAIDISFLTGGFSTYLANELLDHLFKVGAYSVPTNLYVGFSTANPGDSAGALAEPSGNNYSRTTLNGWDTASAGATANTADFEGPVASGSWGTLTHVGIFDAVTSGNMLLYAALGSSLAITTGLFPEFLAGELDVTLT